MRVAYVQYISHICMWKAFFIIITVIDHCDLKSAINKKKYEYLKWIIWSLVPRKVYSTECDKHNLIICYTLGYITFSIQYCRLSIICIYWWNQVENCCLQYQNMFRKFDWVVNQLTWKIQERNVSNLFCSALYSNEKEEQ